MGSKNPHGCAQKAGNDMALNFSSNTTEMAMNHIVRGDETWD
jgi:hypothetical protein